MADSTEELLTGTVDDYLVSLAWSLQQAQQQLSELSAAGPTGEFPVTYQIPEMEFELKMSLELRQSTEVGQGAGAKILRGNVLSGRSAETNASTAASTIKGRFVAVPSRGGNPPPVLTVSLSKPGAGSIYGISVAVSSVSGEALVDVPVHFNIDRDLSDRLNGRVPLASGTTLSFGVVRTGSDGVASCQLSIASGDRAKRVAVIIDAMGRTETVVFGGDDE